MGIAAGCIEYIKILRSSEAPEIDNITNSQFNGYSIKKIAFFIGCEDNRSERYRVFNIINELRKRNIAVDIYRAKCIKYLMKNMDYDLLVIFREDRYRLLRWKKILKLVRSCGTAIIYDTDDFTIEDETKRSAKNVLNIVKHVDAMTVTTEFLAEKFRGRTGKDVYVVKNTINDEQLYIAAKIKPTSESETIKIVYQSGTPTHNLDFEQAEDALAIVLQKYSHVELHIFGPLQLSGKFAPYMQRIYFHPYVDYRLLEVYVSDMNVNIAPLELNDFNNSKSELKIFESALLQIPTIASPSEPYKAIIKNGTNGFIARTKEEWIETLEKLINNREYCEEIGKRAKQDFVPLFSISSEINNVIAIYEKICADNREAK